MKDPLYHSLEVAKLIRYVMEDGKKNVAEYIVYKVCHLMEEKKHDPVQTIKRAVEQVAPMHEVKPKRVGGASYLIPIETRRERKMFLALNWIIEAAKTKSHKEHPQFLDKLCAELMDAATGQGEAIKKKIQIEKLAKANQAFAHFKW